MKPINQQTPGPLYVGLGNRIQTGKPDSFSSGCILADMTHSTKREQGAEADLFASSYTAFDRAGRELGVDAAELAESIDLAEVIRYALDYAQINTAEHDKHNVGRPDQTAAARKTLAGLRALIAAQ